MIWVWAAVALALGGLMKGATGAGTPIVAVPVIALGTGDVGLAVSLLVIPNFVSNVWQGWNYRRQALPWSFTLVFALAGLVGAGLGTILLARLSADYLILMTAASVYLYVAFRLARPDWVLNYRVGRRMAAPAGLLGGTLQGAVGVSAPVSISFLNALGLERPVFVGTISAFFTAMCLSQFVLLWIYQILTPERAVFSLVALIPILGMMPVGAMLARRISPTTFNRVILALLVLVATRLAWSALA